MQPIREMASVLARKVPSNTLAEEEICDFLETVYYASLIGEEGRYPQFSVAFIDDINRSRPLGDDEWSPTPIHGDLPFSASTLAKLGPGAPLDYAQIGVRKFAGKFMVTWLIDHPGGTHRFIEGWTRLGLPRPGLFEVSVEKPGQLLIISDNEVIGRIQGDRIIDSYPPVFWDGPLSERLKAQAQKHSAEFRRRNGDQIWGGWFYDYRHMLQIVLRDMQVAGHGGAIIMTPKYVVDKLQLTNQIDYGRLGKSLTNRQLDKGEPEVETQLLGCARFIARLTRVDGAVLMSPGARVLAYGVKIASTTEVKAPKLALDTKAMNLIGFDFKNKGTRHLSMLRYCMDDPDAIGFVVSQDGGVVAVMQYEGELIVWENVNVFA